MEDKEVGKGFGACSLSKDESWSFEKEHGFNSPRPIGPRILVQSYIKELSDTIISPDKVNEMQKWESIVGRVCKIGSASFKGERFKDWATEELPKVGDWVTFRPGSGTLKKYGPAGKGVLTLTIYDDAIDEVVEDPAYVDRE